MSTEKDDGDPAFPLDTNTAIEGYTNEGMSLRDWFAEQALAGLLASGSYATFPVAATDAYPGGRPHAREAHQGIIMPL